LVSAKFFEETIQGEVRKCIAVEERDKALLVECGRLIKGASNSGGEYLKEGVVWRFKLP
jgi:hypothetical protein